MSGRNYTIDSFRPNDAAGVADLFREVYGDGYPVKTVYNPEQLVASVESHEHIPFVARTPDNTIVGFTSLYRSAPYKGMYEAGLALVSHDYRNTPVYGLLCRRTIKAAFAVPGLDVLFFEGVCNHTIVQKSGIMFKHIETAIEIDLMPFQAYQNGQTTPGRVSTADMFRTFVHRPHVVYVPEVYGACVRYIYDGFDDSRTSIPSVDHLPSGGLTEISTKVFDFARLARVTIHKVGADFEAAFEAEEKRISNGQCEVLQVWLKLSWPWVGDVVDVLRNRGFFLGGILPRWFGEDGFLMQKVLQRPNWEGINLYTDRAEQILHFIRDDWERTRDRVKP
jgi:hypothetical protein